MADPRPEFEANPVLSVVVVSFNSAALLDECLAALISQPGARQIEIHVISKEPSRNASSDAGQIPRIQWLQVPATTTIPEMRSLGIARSKAELLALIEDDCVVGPQWLQSILSAHQCGHVAVGGAIEPGNYTRGLEWGVFYCEYGRFLEPFSGIVNVLPGNNVSYKADVLGPALIKDGFYEVFIHEKWQKAGTELFAASGMVVKNNNSWRYVNCTAVPFHHGRAYAVQRFGGRFSTGRLVYGLLATLLPIVKFFRTIRQVHSRRRPDLPLLKALPWILIFHGFWSAGELVGYLVGPGESIEKWS